MIKQELNLRVSDLPECYFKERLVDLVKDPDESDVWVVAVEGVISDWTAYVGWPLSSQLKAERLNEDTFYYSTQHRAPGQVAERGDKLSYATAKAIFPTMDGLCKEGYRD